MCVSSLNHHCQLEKRHFFLFNLNAQKVKKKKKRIENIEDAHAYVMSSVLKFETIVLIKLSLMMTARIDFQSLAFSPSNKQIDSRATLTIAGGLAIERTSTKCCFFIDFTAIRNNNKHHNVSINYY